jgi:TonB family protein
VIKKEAAHAKYGEKGKNGAVEIITKTDGQNTPKLITVHGFAIPTKTGQSVTEKSAAGFQPEKVVTGYPTNVTLSTVSDDILNFSKVDIVPEFPGGMRKFYEYVAQNYDYPATARAQNISGRVTLSFIVEKDGSLSDIKILKDLGYGTGEEAVRLLKNSPKWNPGILNGKPVRVAYALPITLNLGKK